MAVQTDEFFCDACLVCEDGRFNQDSLLRHIDLILQDILDAAVHLLLVLDGDFRSALADFANDFFDDLSPCQQVCRQLLALSGSHLVQISSSQFYCLADGCGNFLLIGYVRNDLQDVRHGGKELDIDFPFQIIAVLQLSETFDVLVCNGFVQTDGDIAFREILHDDGNIHLSALDLIFDDCL